MCGRGMGYGTRVHEVAEMIVKGIEDKAMFSEYREVDNIRKVFDTVKDAPIVEAEAACILPVNEYNLAVKGIIDLFVEYGDHVEIHDWKTDVTKRFEKEYMFQLSVYAHVASGFTGKPARCFIQYISLGETKEFEPLPYDVVLSRVKDYVERGGPFARDDVGIEG